MLASITLPFDASWLQIAVALLGALSLGISKSGFPGLAIINVIIIAELFGPKNSVGIILPLLIVCDLIVYPLFRKYASWREILPLLPFTVLGLIIGYFVLGAIDDLIAKRVIGLIILLMVSIQLLRKWRENFLTNLPDSRAFLVGCSLTIGVSTMMANAAGPVYAVYALVRKLSKEDFLGIGARFFLVVNLSKVPLLSNLNLINADSLKLDAMLLPGIIGGIFLGKFLIERVPQKVFDWLLYIFSIIGGLRLLFW